MMLNINEGRLQALSSQFNIDPADLIGLLAALTSNSKQNETQEAAEQSIIEQTAYEDDNRKYDPLCRGDVSCITSESDFEGDAIYRILYSGLYADYAGGVVPRSMVSDVEHKIEQKAKEIGKTDLQRFFRKKAKEKKQMLKNEAEKERKKEALASGVVGLTNFQNLPDDISNMYVGPEWSCSDDGIVYIPQNSSQLPATVCSHPVLATRIRRSITTGMEQVEIAYSKNNSWRKRVFDKSIIASNANITKLYDFGISVTSDNAKGMVKYLQNLIDETEKAGAMPVTRTTQQLGWMGDKQFFPYTECDGLEFEKDDDYPGMLEDMRPHGDRDTWLRTYTEQRKNKDLIFFEAISLSAPIVGLLGVDGIVGNLYGISGCGKSVTSEICRSLWCKPSGRDGGDDKHQNAMFSGADTTPAALESRLFTLNNLPAFLEDAENMRFSSKKDLQYMIYKISNGQNRARAQKNLTLRQNRTWGLTACITSEQDITENFTTTGGINRCLRLHSTDKCEYENIGGTLKILNENYAFAGKEFVQALITEGKDKIRQRVDENLKKIEEIAQDKQERQFLPIAIMLTAEQIAKKYVFNDNKNVLTAEDCLEFMADKEESNQYKRFYNYLNDTFAEHKANFEDARKEFSTVYGEFWGLVDGNKISVLPSIIKRLADEQNVSMKMFVDWLKAKKLVVLDSKGNAARGVCKKTQDGIWKARRMYTIIFPDAEFDLSEIKEKTA